MRRIIFILYLLTGMLQASAQTCVDIKRVKYPKAEELSANYFSMHGVGEVKKASWLGNEMGWLPTSADFGQYVEDVYTGDLQYVEEKHMYQYDQSGKVVVESTSEYEYHYAYDMDGRLTSLTTYLIEGDQKTPSKLVEYGYDSKIRNLVDKETKCDFVSGQWRKISEDVTEIKRNDSGNITSVRDYVDGEKSSEWFTIAYDDKGQACEICYYENDNFLFDVKNIEWELTDGQIINVDFLDIDFYTGANRISRALISMPRFLSYDFNIISYPGDKTSALTDICVMIIGNGKNLLTSTCMFATPENTYVEWLNEEGRSLSNNDSEDLIYRNELMCILNKFGLETYRKYSDNSGEYIGTGTVDYDTSTLLPSSYTYTVKKDLEGIMKDTRVIEFGAPLSGVAEIERSIETKDIKYFDMHGRRIANVDLAPGIYIKIQGDNTSKILVR